MTSAKMWLKKGEWHSYAACGGSDIFTQETLTADELEEVRRTCGVCRVRPECIKTCLDEAWCSVVVAGVPLPDPADDKSLCRIYQHLRETLPAEFEARGEDI